MRQVDGESRAGLFRGVNVDRALVRGGDSTCDVQTESESFGSTGPISSLLHWLEDAAHFRRRNRSPIVVNCYLNLVSSADRLDSHRLFGISVPYGVLHQVR